MNFHCKYIKSKFDAKLLFTDTGSLVYEIKTEDVYEDFYEDKNLFDVSDHPLNSKFFDPVNKKVIGKMKDEFKGKMIKRHFNKNRIMSAEEKERFQLSNSCLICDELFDVSDDKVRDHCHITGKYRSAALWSCNIKFKLLIKKVLGKMKDEFKEKIISEFIELKSKMHSLISVDHEEVMKEKGVNKN